MITRGTPYLTTDSFLDVVVIKIFDWDGTYSLW